jgi:branched-chain amino acid transport system ATP-binding protein
VLLKVSGVEAGYKNKQVLFGVSLEVAPGEIVSLLGHNGAGKSTLLGAIYGLIGISRGQVEFLGEKITGNAIRANVRKGLAFVAGGHQVFNELSVMENFKIIKYLHKQEDFDARLETVLRIFPRMKERRGQIARTMSGGEQQMLAIALGLLMNPRLLILDEPSLGLAPLLVASIMETIQFINREYQVGILLVEQNIKYAVDISSRIYVMRLGKILLHSPAEEFKKRESYVDLF